jgi:hypothetical protein
MYDENVSGIINNRKDLSQDNIIDAKHNSNILEIPFNKHNICINPKDILFTIFIKSTTYEGKKKVRQLISKMVIIKETP